MSRKFFIEFFGLVIGALWFFMLALALLARG